MKTGIIGYGSMGKMLLWKFHESGKVASGDLYAANRTIEKLEEALEVVEEEMSPEARAVVEEQGVVYNDRDGDLVTSIVNNKDCVFASHDPYHFFRYCSRIKQTQGSITI